MERSDVVLLSDLLVNILDELKRIREKMESYDVLKRVRPEVLED